MLINFNDRHAITVSGINNCPGKAICDGDLVLFTMKKTIYLLVLVLSMGIYTGCGKENTEIENSLKIHRRNGCAGRAFGNPRVSRQAEQFVKQRTFFQFKGNRVLPAAASDNSYVYFFHFVPVNA